MTAGVTVSAVITKVGNTPVKQRAYAWVRLSGGDMAGREVFVDTGRNFVRRGQTVTVREGKDLAWHLIGIDR